MKNIILGTAEDGTMVEIDLKTFLTTRGLIQASSGGGKSRTLRRMAEQFFGKVQTFIIDKEGEFPSLREKYGYALVGNGGETPTDPRTAELVCQRLLENNVSSIFDLYNLKDPERHHWVKNFLDALMNAPKNLWHPVIVIVDEAHRYSPERGMGESEAYSAMIDLATDGRKRGFCLLPGQKIITRMGRINIEDIKVGDEVLTHRGRFRKVVATSSRRYDGRAFEIRSRCSKMSTCVTEDHRLAVHRTHNNGAGTRVVKELDWVKAKDLLIGDKRDQTRILSPFLGVSENKKFLEVEFDPRFRAPLTRRGKERRKLKKFRVVVCPELMRAFGWYLAEGSVSRRQLQVEKHLTKVIFTLGSHEEAEVTQLRKDLQYLGLKTHLVRHSTSIRVQVCSRGFAQLVSTLFGEGSHNKHIPMDVLMLDSLLLKELLHAYCEGDGWFDGRSTFRAVATTVSTELLYDLKLLAEKAGYFCAISKERRAHEGSIRGRPIRGGPSYSISFSALSMNQKKLVSGHSCHSISLKREFEYHGHVHDLEVDEDHSYCTPVHVVHNCAVYATQRLGKLSKNASAELLNRFIGRTLEDIDVDRAADLMSVRRSDRQEFDLGLKTMKPGRFWVFGQAVSIERKLIHVGPVDTTHPEPGTPAAAVVPPTPEMVKKLLPQLADLPKEAENKARTEAEMKQEIFNLKARLAVAEKRLTEKTVTVTVEKPVEKIVEIPAIDAKTIKAVHQVIWNLERAAGKFDKLLEMKEEMNNWCERLGKDINEAIDAQDNVRRAPVMVPQQEGRLARTPVAQQREEPSPEPPETSGPALSDGEPLSRPQITILRGLREFNSIDVDHVSRHQLAGWLGKKVTGSFLNDLSRLKALNMVDYYTTPTDERTVLLTNEGLKHAPPLQWEVSPDGVFSQVLSAVTGPQQEILQVCRAVFPKWISREDLAQKMEKTVSGSFLNDLSKLHTAEMVEYGAGDYKQHVRLMAWTILASAVPA